MAGSSRRPRQRCREIERRPESTRKVPSGLERLRGMYLGALVLACLFFASPLATQAQHAGKVYRIGVLSTGGPEQENFIWADLRGLLRERGWVEGQNLVIEWRYAEAKYERLPALAGELVRLQPDLIMARGGPGTTAAKQATTTIPIVMYGATR